MLTTNLVEYWKMENTNGELAAYNLSAVGSPSTVAAKIGNGRQYVGGTGRDTFNFTSALPAGSVSLWFKYTGINASYGRLFSKTQAGVTDAIIFAITSGNQLNVVLQDTSIYTGTSLSTGTWYHLVVTWDGANVITYINGSQVNNSSSTKTLQANARPIMLAGTDVNTQGMSGILDEVGLWSRPLSSSEVTELYNGGNGFQYPFVASSLVSKKHLGMSQAVKRASFY